MSDNSYALEMIDISKSFPGVKALDKARLAVRKGTVHALMGENGAGKSTLMKCLFGIYKEDEGDIRINGSSVRFTNPKQALENGVSMVHQELNQVLQRDVMDNIWLGRYPTTGITVNRRKMYTDTKRIFDELGLDIDPRTKMASLSVSARQMVEIAKAVSYNAKILVLDEPTSSLTEKEVEHLFRIIKKLTNEGCCVIYISHKMEEILTISDEVTIMRDGQYVGTWHANELTTDLIIKRMVGRDLTHRFPPKDNVPGETIMQVNNLTAKYQPSIKNVSFELRRGEILGVAGLMGAGRTELLETIFGIAKHSEGEIFLHGEKVENTDSAAAIKNGFALLTEERRFNGIFGGLDITFNATIANIDSYTRSGILKGGKMKKDTQWVIDAIRVKTPTQQTRIKTLSGGNQQKVILGRWLLTKPEILLLDEPTRGIDVGAKYEIYQLIINLAKEGKAVMMVSSEMPELLGLCDRILVMSGGRVAGIADTNELNQEEILRMAAKYI